MVTDVDDAGLLAALVRGLVETAAEQWAAGVEPLDWRCEELRAARWRASRYGLADELLDPASHELRPAREVVAALVDLVARAARRGRRHRPGGGRGGAGAGRTGASRQRAAYERTGSIEGVVGRPAGAHGRVVGPPRAALESLGSRHG